MLQVARQQSWVYDKLTARHQLYSDLGLPLIPHFCFCFPQSPGSRDFGGGSVFKSVNKSTAQFKKSRYHRFLLYHDSSCLKQMVFTLIISEILNSIAARDALLDLV